MKDPNGSNFLIPKSDGDIYMVSRYPSREFGLGLGTKLTPTILGQISCAKRTIKYTRSEYSILINVNDSKLDSTDNPILRAFYAGVSHEGY